MSERKDIDRLFQEKFKDFEQSPPPEMWSRIEQELNKDKKKRRIVPIWWRLGGVAALLILFIAVGTQWFNSSNDLVSPVEIVDSEKEVNSPETEESPDSINSINDQTNTLIANEEIPKIIEKTGAQNSSELDYNSTPVAETHSGVAQNQSVQQKEESADYRVASNTKSSTSDAFSNTLQNENQLNSVLEQKGYSSVELDIHANTKWVPENTIEKESVNQSQTIEEAIAQAEALKNEPQKEAGAPKWSITPVVAPVYSVALGEGSTIHSQFNENSKSSDVTMSYGVGGSYAISKRFKVRAGVNRVDFSNTTNDVMTFSAVEVAAQPKELAMASIVLNNDSNVYVMSGNSVYKAAAAQNTVVSNEQMGQLVMDYGFIELPLALEYRLVDQKFGVNLVGGFSTFLLNNNEISAEVNGENTVIGESSNLNDTSFSANFGLGLDYGISKQLNITLEPTLKYQINTFANTFGDIQPMFFGIYTGLSFKF